MLPDTAPSIPSPTGEGGDGPTTTVTGPEQWATGAPAIVSSITRSVGAMGVRRATKALTVINQPNGFDCPGCAWPEAPPGERHRVEFCESGAKAVAEEGTKSRVGAAFFAEHSVATLLGKSDWWLGQQGRWHDRALWRGRESTRKVAQKRERGRVRKGAGKKVAGHHGAASVRVYNSASC